MTGYVVIVAVSALAFLALTELVAAALPVIIVIAAVPPEERESLAKVLAACDSRRRLRLWPALRVAVRERRAEETRIAEETRNVESHHAESRHLERRRIDGSFTHTGL
jgi:hypothetical protein